MPPLGSNPGGGFSISIGTNISAHLEMVTQIDKRKQENYCDRKIFAENCWDVRSDVVY